MCGVLGMPRATYYWMLSHPGPEPADDPIAADVVWIYGGGPPRIRRAQDKARVGEGGHRGLQAPDKADNEQERPGQRLRA